MGITGKQPFWLANLTLLLHLHQLLNNVLILRLVIKPTSAIHQDV